MVILDAIGHSDAANAIPYVFGYMTGHSRAPNDFQRVYNKFINTNLEALASPSAPKTLYDLLNKELTIFRKKWSSADYPLVHQTRAEDQSILNDLVRTITNEATQIVTALRSSAYTTLLSEGTEYTPADRYAIQSGIEVIKLDRAARYRHRAKPVTEEQPNKLFNQEQLLKIMTNYVSRANKEECERRWVRKICSLADPSKAILMVQMDQLADNYGLVSDLAKKSITLNVLRVPIKD